ncbi:MAG TPA: type I secretion system permease/ATPase [Alphaproteobacteria bacterium]|nr:type I secretion system permease/ATPase [Alphaproteobacteria bacterium]
MTATFSLVMNVLVLAVPLYTLQVYDRVLSSQSSDTLLWLTAVVVFMVGILAVLDALRARMLVRLSIWLERRFAAVLLRLNLSGDLGRYGLLGTQGLDDLGALRRFLTGPGATNLFDAPWVPVYVVVIGMLSPWLGVIAVVSAVLLFLTGLANELVTRRALREASAIGSESTAALRTILLGAESVRALGMREAVLERWRRSNERVLGLQSRASDRAGLIQSIARFERLAAQIAIVGAGAWLVIAHEITPGALIAASIIVSRALAPAEGLIGSWRSVVGARDAYRRVTERLRSFRAAAGLQLPAPEGRVDVENATVHVPGVERPILQSVRFTLLPGESLGIVGPSGAGKSTLGRAILGLVPLSAGAIRLDGADIATWDSDQLGRHIGYLPQDVRLFPGTVAENIARLGARDDAMVVEAARAAGAHEMVLRLPRGYDTDIDPASPSLSGGQKQLIALARAFYGRPRLLVLDEPNSNLDRDGETALLGALARAREAGITTIVIAHRPSMVAELDRLLVLRDGRISMIGPRAEVLARTTGAVTPFKRPALGANSQPVQP